MRNAALTSLLILCCASAFAAPRVTNLSGVRLDARREQVRERLARNAKLERTEKRQEVWTLANDPRYASLIVGYTPEGTVRFVTAIAKQDGTPVRYAEVANVTGAEHRAAGATHTYTWTAGERSVIAIGDAQRVQYLSLKKAPEREEEDEDEDD